MGIAMVALFGIAGCAAPEESAPAAAPTPTAMSTATSTDGPGTPRAGTASTALVDIEGIAQPLRVEVADSPVELARGLMRRTDLPEGTGMLFVFPARESQSFWMKDTLIPLDIAWIREDRITGTTAMEPCRDADSGCPSYPSPGEVDAAIEAPPGTFEGVPDGARVQVRE